jgi:hypothetical protein
MLMFVNVIDCKNNARNEQHKIWRWSGPNTHHSLKHEDYLCPDVALVADKSTLTQKRA